MPEGGADIQQNLGSKDREVADPIKNRLKRYVSIEGATEAARYLSHFFHKDNEIPEHKYCPPMSRDLVAKENAYIRKALQKINEQDHANGEKAFKKKYESKLRSSAFEYVFSGVAKMGWFGTEAASIPTELSDDIGNGVDNVLEMRSKDGEVRRLALAFDITMSTDPDVIRKKIEHNLIEKMMKKGVEVTFFKSQLDKDFVGTLKNCVPAVIGLDNLESWRLIDDFAKLTELEITPQKTKEQVNLINEIKESISADPSQILILEEIQMQLDMYKDVFDKIRNERFNDLIKQVNVLSEVIENICMEKEEMVFSSEVDRLRKKDLVYGSIKEWTEKVKISGIDALKLAA